MNSSANSVSNAAADSVANPVANAANRTASVERNTNETQIGVDLNLDGTGRAELATGVPFLDHMLDQVARHGMLDLTVRAKGDLHIDGHHTVEDIGITFGQAFKAAVGDKRGIVRYGYAYVPLDEAISRAVCFRPKRRICSGVGPMKTMPACAQASANAAFSLRKP